MRTSGVKVLTAGSLTAANAVALTVTVAGTLGLAFVAVGVRKLHAFQEITTSGGTLPGFTTFMLELQLPLLGLGCVGVLWVFAGILSWTKNRTETTVVLWAAAVISTAAALFCLWAVFVAYYSTAGWFS